MRKYLFALYTILLSFLLTPLGEIFADSGDPYSTHIGFDWWVILIIVLAALSTIGLIVFLILNHKKK